MVSVGSRPGSVKWSLPCSPVGSDIWTAKHCHSPQLRPFPMGCCLVLPDRKEFLSSEYIFLVWLGFFVCVCFKKVPDGSFLFTCCTRLAWQIVSCGDILVLYMSYTAM